MNSKTKKGINKIDINSLKKLISFLESFGKPYFIHAGFGLHLRGFSAELDDIDVKVFHNNLEDIYSSAKNFFEDKILMKEKEIYHFGSYMFPRVEIELKTLVDICSRTGTVNDLGEVEFPYSSDVFKNIQYFTYDGVKVPVSSLESLFLYYLVLRRGPKDRKDDNQKIKEIVNSGKLNENRFFSLLYKHPKEKEIIQLYRSYLQ